MKKLRGGIWSLVVLLGLFVGGPAQAEVWTASFNGIAYGYDNHGPYAPLHTGFITDASGSLIFDPAQVAFNGFFFGGPGIELNFKVWDRKFTYGGIGADPVTMPDGAFSAESLPHRQKVTFVGGNGGCGSLCSASLTLTGPLGAFGPDDLTPQTFHPGTSFFDGSSFASFGNRDFGANILLTSIRFTPSVSTVPEPGTSVMMLSGFFTLAALAGWRGMRGA